MLYFTLSINIIKPNSILSSKNNDNNNTKNIPCDEIFKIMKFLKIYMDIILNINILYIKNNIYIEKNG